MTVKQTIDFSVPNPAATANFSLPLFQWCDFEPAYKCWSIGAVGGFFKFNLQLPKQQGINLIFQLCSSTVNGTTNCPIDITVNGKELVKGFDPHITSFYDQVWPIPASMLKAGANEIRMTLSGGFSKVFMRKAIVDLYEAAQDEKAWLAQIPDATNICDINIPGTHDSAAINASVSTPYACHRFSITDQLGGGVRLLDVRIKVKQKSSKWEFATCHSDIGLGIAANEYQSLPSLLDECKAFLSANPTEMVAMTLKVDDWNGFGSQSAAALNALDALLKTYPVTASANMQTLGQVRGKIVMLNRIDGTLRFGAPISIPDNTTGAFVSGSPNRNYEVYVQDQYKGLPNFGSEHYKTQLVITATGHKNSTGTRLLLNFASATYYGILGVYIMGNLLGSFFGSRPASNRPAIFGWTLFDYQFEQYQTDTYGWMHIVRMIIASNHGYAGLDKTFKIIGHDEL